MNDALIRRMRKARQSQVDVGRFKFTILRPQEGEMVRVKNMTAVELATEYVIDWHGVTEADLVPSGGSDPVAFDRELWFEWCRDRHDFWSPINNALNTAIADHINRREEAAKN